MTLMSEAQKGKKIPEEDGGDTWLFFLLAQSSSWFWGDARSAPSTQMCQRPPWLQALRAGNSQRGGSPAQAWDLCKVLAYCLILRSIAPALPETCRDLDAF